MIAYQIHATISRFMSTNHKGIACLFETKTLSEKKLKIYIFLKEREKNVTECNTVQHNKCMSKTLLLVKHWRNETSICTELGSFDNHFLSFLLTKNLSPMKEFVIFFLANIEKNHVSPTLTRGRKKHK